MGGCPQENTEQRTKKQAEETKLSRAKGGVVVNRVGRRQQNARKKEKVEEKPRTTNQQAEKEIFITRALKHPKLNEKTRSRIGGEGKNKRDEKWQITQGRPEKPSDGPNKRECHS